MENEHVVCIDSSHMTLNFSVLASDTDGGQHLVLVTSLLNIKGLDSDTISTNNRHDYILVCEMQFVGIPSRHEALERET